MRYKSRELRRLWEVKVYEGDPDAKNPKIHRGTVIAFNSVEALRLCGGKAAEPPREVCFVTWPETHLLNLLMIFSMILRLLKNLSLKLSRDVKDLRLRNVDAI
jgi:hypothetical protein